MPFAAVRTVDIGFRPCQIVAFLGGVLGDPFVNELARRFFDRSEVAGRHMDFTPCFLFACQCNQHDSLYHKSR